MSCYCMSVFDDKFTYILFVQGDTRTLKRIRLLGLALGKDQKYAEK